MVISERKGVWRITRLILDHNHALSPGAKIFRAHKNMTEQEKKMIRTLNKCNIPTKTEKIKVMVKLLYRTSSPGSL